MDGKTTVSSSGTSRRRSIGLRNVSRRGGLSTAPRNLSECDGPRPDAEGPVQLLAVQRSFPNEHLPKQSSRTYGTVRSQRASSVAASAKTRLATPAAIPSRRFTHPAHRGIREGGGVDPCDRHHAGKSFPRGLV